MERFEPLLDRTARALDLPAPQTAQIVEELAADATDLFEHLRGRGIPEDAAAAEVERWLSARPEIVRELRSIHRPVQVRWAERLAGGRDVRLERFALIVIVAGLLVAALRRLAGAQFMAAPPWSVYLVIAAGSVVAAVVCERVHALVMRPRAARSRENRRRGLRLLAHVSAVTPAVALLGAATVLAGVPLEDAGDAWRAAGIASELLAAGLAVALLSGAAWLGLEARVRRLERLDTIDTEDVP